jgi:hypothetical protein
MPYKKHSTIIGQTRQLRWWRDQLGHRTLAEITPAIIIEHRDKLTCSGSTVHRYMAILSHAFTVATKEWQWVDDSLLDTYRLLYAPSLTMHLNTMTCIKSTH